MALIRNCHKDPKARLITGYDVWHRPGAQRPTSSAFTAEDLHGLREGFTKRLP
jgi:hypothetical protein